VYNVKPQLVAVVGSKVLITGDNAPDEHCLSNGKFSLWNCRRRVDGNKGVGLPRSYISSPFMCFIH